LQILLGGTPFEGGAIGVILQSLALTSEGERLTATDTGSRVTASTSMFGMFIDYFPNPRKNLHFGGALTLLSHSLVLDSEVAEEDLDEMPRESAGLGISAWVGQGLWISDNWSIDGTLQLSASSGQSNEQDLATRSFAVVGLFTFLLH
jgi:hypothetical protein